MKVAIKDFEDFLFNKNLKKRTVEQYVYYFLNFSLIGKKFNQMTVNKFLSSPSNKNSVARSFLVNFKKFLILNYRELGLSTEERLEIAEVEIPELTGRKKQRLIHPLTEEQVLGLEKYLKEEKYKLQLLLSFYGGLRIGELLKIQIVSFNWEEWKKDMAQYGECRVYGKGNKEGIAFFPPWLMKRIARFIRMGNFKSLSSYIFLNKVENLENINFENRKVAWNTVLKKAGIAAGLTKLNSEGKPIKETVVHPHRLRHSFGFHLKTIRKLDIRDIQELLRHSSISSTQIYTKVEKGYLKERLKGSDSLATIQS